MPGAVLPMQRAAVPARCPPPRGAQRGTLCAVPCRRRPPALARALFGFTVLAMVALAGCGGGGSGATPAPVPAPAPSPPPVGGGGSGTAALLAAKMGKPARLLVGLGTGSEFASITRLGVTPDLVDRYLTGAGAGDWTTYVPNAPAGAYIDQVTQASDAIGAVPLFTLYQMATNGDGNLASLTDAAFMTRYWSNVRVLFTRLGSYGKPALVHFEPDFWGYVQQQPLPANDPARRVARVGSVNPDCTAQPDDVSGVAGCLISMARQYAPRALVGFSPSIWGSRTTAGLVAFMNQVGAARADFIVMQTLDRDAGCFESKPQPAYCTDPTGSGWYWDATNATRPNFTDHLAFAKALHDGIGGLPLIWWQTPMGVPSQALGGATGSTGAWRDNRAQYFLTHPAELVAAGGLAVVFGHGEAHQTSLDNDGGQYGRLSRAYLASPAALP
jgi:hypothetical protein